MQRMQPGAMQGVLASVAGAMPRVTQLSARQKATFSTLGGISGGSAFLGGAGGGGLGGLGGLGGGGGAPFGMA